MSAWSLDCVLALALIALSDIAGHIALHARDGRTRQLLMTAGTWGRNIGGGVCIVVVGAALQALRGRA